MHRFISGTGKAALTGSIAAKQTAAQAASRITSPANAAKKLPLAAMVLAQGLPLALRARRDINAAAQRASPIHILLAIDD
jgi:hypothetical protein